MSEAVIELRGLAKSFRVGLFHQRRVQPLRPLDLEVRRGETFGFVGPNGAGKTTTIKLLVGLLRPSAGTVRILGRTLPDRQVQRQIGFMPEVANFYEYLSGLELLQLHARLLGLPPREGQRRIAALVERGGMAGRADRPLRKFSKGMVQRIGLAQALLGEPQLLILDEPMSGLDPTGRHDIREIILEEKRRGTTVFFSSHILSDVEQLCDRVGILAGGSLRKVGRVDEIGRDELRSQEVVLRPAAPLTLPEGLAGQVLDRRTDGETTALLLAADADLGRLLQEILAQGGQILEVRRHTLGLEELFLRETREEQR